MQTLGWKVNCYEDFTEQFGTIANLYGSVNAFLRIHPRK